MKRQDFMACVSHKQNASALALGVTVRKTGVNRTPALYSGYLDITHRLTPTTVTS